VSAGCHRQNVLQVFPCGCEFSHVGASFQLALPFDKMEILSPQETRWKSCRHKRYRHLILNWFRTGGGDLVGSCRGIQRQGETDRQKSLWIENAARHRNRDVSPDSRLWINYVLDRTMRSRVRSTLKNRRFSSGKSPWMTFPTGRWGTPYPRRNVPADSAEKAFSEGSFSQWGKGHRNCKSRASRLWINRVLDRTMRSRVRNTRKKPEVFKWTLASWPAEHGGLCPRAASPADQTGVGTGRT